MDKPPKPVHIPEMFKNEFAEFKKIEQIMMGDIEHLIADFNLYSIKANNLVAKIFSELQEPAKENEKQ